MSAKPLPPSCPSDPAPHETLLALFVGETSPVYHSARIIVPEVLAAAERYAKQWLRRRAPRVKMTNVRTRRFAAIVGGSGIELALQFGLSSGEALNAVYQSRRSLNQSDLHVVAANLASRRYCVPARQIFEAVIISADSAAA